MLTGDHASRGKPDKLKEVGSEGRGVKLASMLTEGTKRVCEQSMLTECSDCASGSKSNELKESRGDQREGAVWDQSAL